MSSNGEFHNFQFRGVLPDLPTPEPTTPSKTVPEPATILGSTAVAGGLATLRRRKFA